MTSEKVVEKISYSLPIIEIMKKELRSYFKSSLIWYILAISLILEGLLGYWGIKKSISSEKTLQFIFWYFSGITMVSSVLLGMRYFAEEKALGTIELLFTSPLTEIQIVLGKFFSAIILLLLLVLASFPIPLVTIIYGSGTIGHIISGYIGVLLIGTATITVTMFYSTLTKIQLMAAIMAGGNLALFLLLGFFSPYISQPMKGIMREFSFYVHYMDFEKGVIVLKHIVFFMSVITFYLYLTIQSLKINRWK